MTVDEIKKAITRAFMIYTQATRSQAQGLAPTRSLTTGKLYEAYALAAIAENLTKRERLRLRLSSGSIVALKSSHGPINRDFPRIDVYDTADHRIAEIWTDVEFLTLSYAGSSPTPGEYHELDIVMVGVGATRRPKHDSIWLGAECKHRGYTKNLLKEILGIRRELSYLQQPRSTKFAAWPRNTVPANPASCLIVYSTDPRVSLYNDPPGRTFGIDFIHEPL